MHFTSPPAPGSLDFSAIPTKMRVDKGRWCGSLCRLPRSLRLAERRDYFILNAFTAKSRSRIAIQIMYRTTLFPIGLISMEEPCGESLTFFSPLLSPEGG